MALGVMEVFTLGTVDSGRKDPAHWCLFCRPGPVCACRGARVSVPVFGQRASLSGADAALSPLQVDTLCLEDLHAFIAQALCLQGKPTVQLVDLEVPTVPSGASPPRQRGSTLASLFENWVDVSRKRWDGLFRQDVFMMRCCGAPRALLGW